VVIGGGPADGNVHIDAVQLLPVEKGENDE
jgi:hypothetical protein